MTDDPLVPGPRRDLAVHNDWWTAGWQHVLPCQSFPLAMLIATASQPGFTGSLDDLLEELFDGDWNMLGGDLDSALTFFWPDSEEDPEEEPEGRQASEAKRRSELRAVLTSAGLPVPTTVRDLSELYLTWGLAYQEQTAAGTRWSMPATLPRPGDLLPLNADLTQRLDSLHCAEHTGPYISALIGHLTDDLGAPEEILTSLDRLAVATGQQADDVRLALTELVNSGDARVWRGQGQADPERLETHQRFRLAVDWDRVDETRLQVYVRTGDEA
ncbi:DUF6042 family protein [Streptomyces sp. NPDC054861]